MRLADNTLIFEHEEEFGQLEYIIISAQDDQGLPDREDALADYILAALRNRLEARKEKGE